MLSFITLIGTHLESAPLAPNDYSIEWEEEEWMKEEGIAPSWNVEAHDGSFSMSLNQQKVIETIWLHPVEGTFAFEDYTTDTLRKQVRKKYGKPDASGEVEESLLQEFSVSWDRYVSEQTTLHFEYSAEDSKLRLITLMDNRIVP